VKTESSQFWLSGSGPAARPTKPQHLISNSTAEPTPPYFARERLAVSTDEPDEASDLG
jgi:hypothetical protein